MKKVIFCLIALFLMLISCKDEKNTIKKDKIHNYEINIVFPDTVYVNEGYDGKIEYKNDLDTLTTEIRKLEKYTRFLDYILLTTKSINYKDDYLKKIANDTFVGKTNRLIPLYNIKFDKLGLNYIDGTITDEVIIENGAKGKNGEPMDRVITNEFRSTKVVYVIEKPKK